MADLPMLEEVGAEAEFISVKVGYRDRLLFPVDEGLQYIKSLRNCLLIKSDGYGDDRVETIHRFKEEIEVNFYSEEEIKELIASQSLLLRGKD